MMFQCTDGQFVFYLPWFNQGDWLKGTIDAENNIEVWDYTVGVKGVVDKNFEAVDNFHDHIRTQHGRLP